jgi:hypothetical protein
MIKNLNQILVLIFVLLIPNHNYAQESHPVIKSIHIFLELGGNGIIYSINYERIISENFALRGGAGIAPGLILVEGTFFHFPLTASYLIGSKTSMLEIGAGATLFT